MKTAEDKEKSTILTCAQPSGILTLGNYLGALRNWATMLDEAECFFGIVDMHSITARIVPSQLRKNTISCLAQYIACGMDPSKSHLFVQSHVIGHAELAWVLGCITPIGDLQRMTQFKEKAARLGFFISDEEESGGLRFQHEGARAQASVNSGLLFYPVLMAADILLYNAERVPVGEDQRQHLELCRDLARRFNHMYSDTFHIPEAYIPREGARIRSLQNPVKKMSKSDDDPLATIFILDEPQRIRKKIMSAVTDSSAEISYDEEKKPGVSNLLQILSAATGKTINTWVQEFEGKGYAELKKQTAEAVIEMLLPVQKRYNEIMEDRSYLDQVQKAGAEAAQRRAYRTLSKVYRKIGFTPRVSV